MALVINKVLYSNIEYFQINGFPNYYLNKFGDILSKNYNKRRINQIAEGIMKIRTDLDKNISKQNIAMAFVMLF